MSASSVICGASRTLCCMRCAIVWRMPVSGITSGDAVVRRGNDRGRYGGGWRRRHNWGCFNRACFCSLRHEHLRTGCARAGHCLHISQSTPSSAASLRAAGAARTLPSSRCAVKKTSTSPRVTRPPGPVPATLLISTPESCASCAATGVARAAAPAGIAAAAGVAGVSVVAGALAAGVTMDSFGSRMTAIGSVTGTVSPAL